MKRESHHSAGVVVYREDGERSYLLLRSALTRRPVWEFPKGRARGRGRASCRRRSASWRRRRGSGTGDYTLIDGFREEERYFFTRGSRRGAAADPQAGDLLPGGVAQRRGADLARGQPLRLGHPRRGAAAAAFPGEAARCWRAAQRWLRAAAHPRVNE